MQGRLACSTLFWREQYRIARLCQPQRAPTASANTSSSITFRTIGKKFKRRSHCYVATGERPFTITSHKHERRLSGGLSSSSSPGDEQESNRTVENRFENAAAFQSKDARMLIEKLAGSFLNTDFPNSCAVKVPPWTLFANLKVILHSLNAGYLPCDFQGSLPRV
jgi:hypothetical protein